jgi:hypothetical protein
VSYFKEGSPVLKVCPTRQLEVSRTADVILTTSITDHEEVKNMWSTYTKEVNKYDESVTTAQRDDANSVLVFVRCGFLLLTSIELTGLKDRSLFCDRRRFRCRKL